MKEQPKISEEEPVTLSQILVGKAFFAGTLGIFLFFVPPEKYFEYFKYTLAAALITAIVSRTNIVSMKVTHYLLFALTGYGIAMWILAITQSFDK